MAICERCGINNRIYNRKYCNECIIIFNLQQIHDLLNKLIRLVEQENVETRT